MGYGID
jgi:hypothetical protein